MCTLNFKWKQVVLRELQNGKLRENEMNIRKLRTERERDKV